MGTGVITMYLCLVVCWIAGFSYGKENTDVRQYLKRLSEQEVRRNSDDCVDIHNQAECERWAQEGECVENPVWMSNNCKSSCELCNGGSPVVVGEVIFASPLAMKFGCRRMAIVGIFLTSISWLICYSWASIYTFYVFLGALTGIAHALTYAASVMVINIYFNKRRYFALALIQAACSLGTLGMGPLVSYLLETYGLFGSMLISAGISFNMTVGALLYIPLEQPGQTKNRANASVATLVCETFKIYRDQELWKRPSFHLMLTSCFLRGFAAYIPLQLLPVYMNSKNISMDIAAICVGVQGAATTVSRVLVGIVSNKYPRLTRLIYIGGGVFGGLCLYTIPVNNSATDLILVSTGYGLCFGSITGLNYVILVDLFGPERLPACFGITVMIDGVGNLMGTPVAGAVAESVDISGVEYILAASITVMCGLVMSPTLFTRRASDS